MASKEKKSQKKDKNTAAKVSKHNPEIGAVVLLLLSVFVFVTNKFPNTTGIVGHWVVAVAAQKMVGRAVDFLPLFLLLPAASLLVRSARHKLSLAMTVVSFTAFTVILEMRVSSHIDRFHWPVLNNGGGLVGNVVLHVLNAGIGRNGTLILLWGIFSISVLVLFNLSLSKSLLRFGHFLRRLFAFSGIDAEHKEELAAQAAKLKSQIPNRPSAFQKLVRLLFFTRVQDEPAAKLAMAADQSVAEPVLSIDMPAPIPPREAPKAERPAIIRPMQENLDEKQNEKMPDSPAEIIELKKAKTPPSPPQENLPENYSLPSTSLLEPPVKKIGLKENERVLQEKARILEQTLDSFGVEAKVVNITPGPSVTRFELQPGVGVKIAKITALSKDIALKLAAADVRIEAPIPGKALVGIEVPNSQVDTVTMRTITDKTDFFDRPAKLLAAMGLTITGEPITMDLSKMPHVLIAGATGSGKSVCVNAIIISILLKATPEEVKFLMIDPKKVELSLYDDIPHLIAPVVTDPHKAAATLKTWALKEMERRYEEFSKVGVKDIDGFNKQFKDEEKEKRIPYIVVIIDELADLMMVASQEVETTICRLAQMARATGIHLVIATQRPSVNVITGLIKANIPSRISFFLQSQIDSRTILDMGGAEKLLGKGDMLYSPVGSFKPMRVQGIYISEKEIKKIVAFVKTQGRPNYLSEVLDIQPLSSESPGEQKKIADSEDNLFDEAKNLVMSTQYASTSYLQRKLRIGYNRAARLMDELVEKGVISDYATEKRRPG